MLSEFDLIERFFKAQSVKDEGTRLAIGDDCALLAINDQEELAVTTDTLVEGVHFLPQADPENLGFKALAVNLSDLAAMGARPRWATLALTLPAADENWLEKFSTGFMGLAAKYAVELIGGDTTRGPLTMTVQALGTVSKGQALRRSAAKSGDLIYVTGRLGEGGLGLKIAQGATRVLDANALNHYHRPLPRVEIGQKLLGLAHACIDISDGLAQDLGHILAASRVGATIEWETMPLSRAVLEFIRETQEWEFPLRAGDDYELCFTLPPAKQQRLETLIAKGEMDAACIGRIEAKPGLRLRKGSAVVELAGKGYRHFGAP